MPTRPDFDLYEVLEVSRTATAQEIKDSYRRLALIHHPDKNRGDQESTARFQRIGLAHETLSDTSLRAAYDNSAPAPQSFPSAGFYYYDDDDESYEDFSYGYTFTSFEDFLRANFSGGYQYNRQSAASQDTYEARCAAVERERRGEEAYRNERREQKQREEAEAETRRQVEAAAQRADEEQKRKLNEVIEQERIMQEQRWARLNATTDAEKQHTCLHVHFWPKEQQKRKFKCDSCGKKGGMIAFRCPHCSLLCCQLCLSKMNLTRSAK